MFLIFFFSFLTFSFLFLIFSFIVRAPHHAFHIAKPAERLQFQIGSKTFEEAYHLTPVYVDYGDLSIFLEHPIAMVLLVIAVISLLSPIIMNAVKKRSAKKQAQ